MAAESAVMCEAYAGLQAQGLGLAEAAGLSPEVTLLTARPPWNRLPAAWWPRPMAAVALAAPPARLIFPVGGTAAAVGAAMRRRFQTRVVQVQNPRMALDRFDLVVANRHDGLTGANVIVTRTALHRANAARLRAAATQWRERLRALPRPLVAVLVGGSNGRFRLEEAEASLLGASLASMMIRDKPGLALTPSRRTAPAAREALRRVLEPMGAWVWDMASDNPYFGMLALADAIVVTADSISMISEAVATRAPVLIAELPGRSRRIGAFLDLLLKEGRVRPFAGRLETWPVEPIDDTPWAGEEVRRRLGL